VATSEVNLPEVLDCERLLLAPDVRSSASRVDALLDPNFSEIDPSGRLWNRAELIGALTTMPEHLNEPIADSEMTGQVLAADLVLLRYVSHHVGMQARHSSLWRRHPDGWRLLFHQGTPLTP